LDRWSVNPAAKTPSLRRGRILRLYPHKPHFLAAKLSENGKRSLLLVHRIVWLTFKGAIPDGAAVIHKDGNPQNNHLDNLQLIEDYWESAAHNLGQNRSALTADKVRAIRAAKGVSQVKLAKQYGVSKTTIFQILHRKHWKHV
jgi:DNA-binding transcriptional regulator YiaG